MSNDIYTVVCPNCKCTNGTQETENVLIKCENCQELLDPGVVGFIRMPDFVFGALKTTKGG